MNFHTMEIGSKDTTMIDSDSWVAFDDAFNGDANENPDDPMAFDSSDNIRPNPPPSDTVCGVDPPPAMQQEDPRLQLQEDVPEAPSDPEQLFDPYNDIPYSDVVLKKTVSADRTGSALTTDTLPETPPRRQTKHTIDYGEPIPMDKMGVKNLSSDTDSNSHDLSDDPEQPTLSEERKSSRRNCIFSISLAFLLLAIAGALGFIVYLQLFHEVGLEEPNVEPSVEPTPLPTELPSSSLTSRPTIDSASPPTFYTPAPTTRPPTSPPSRSPSHNPSFSPTDHPTVSPSLNPTSVREELRDLITKITDGTTIQAIDTPGTPQQLAFDWVHKDPAYMDFKKRRIVQRFAMATLYYSTVGSETSTEAMATWLDHDTNECTWFMSWYQNRIPCGSDNVFKTVALRNVALAGTIPSELALLTHLNTLVLSDNMLTGTIPKEFGQWASLIKLDVHSNFLHGSIPKWTNAPNLQELNLGSNRLSGDVPASIANLNLTSLDLSENNVQGIIPPDFCRTSEQIELMTVDCDKVSCFCCTQCGAIRTRAPVLTPFTPPPSGPPTRMPTPAPTRCKTNIRVSKRCYKVGDPIEITFSNCSPRAGDWIGLYDAENPVSLLLDPLLWHRSCGSKSCSESPVHGSSTLDQSAEGQAFWPLPRGNYKVYLIRNGSTFPYQPVVGSEQIRVAQSICPD